VTEVEAKLRAPSVRVLDRIAALETIAGSRVEPRPLLRLETLYVDTASGALRAAEVAVRFRNDGAATELTVKRRGDVRDDIHRRPEWTVRLEAPPVFPYEVREPLAGEIGDVALDGPLLPLVETAILRRPLHVQRDGRLIAEIDLDEVEFRIPGTGARSEPSFEVEVESVDGDEREIVAIVSELRAHHPLEPARRSKLERALDWTAGLGG
jgi:inorganic triphosphatase YgiF